MPVGVGVCAGVLEKTIAAMQVAPDEILAWIGPAIGSTAFEVGDEVKAAFVAHDPQAAAAFVVHQDKWLADLFMLARQRISAAGVSAIYGGISAHSVMHSSFTPTAATARPDAWQA
jgi:Uncharacterized conserved protein